MNKNQYRLLSALALAAMLSTQTAVPVLAREPFAFEAVYEQPDKDTAGKVAVRLVNAAKTDSSTAEETESETDIKELEIIPTIYLDKKDFPIKAGDLKLPEGITAADPDQELTLDEVEKDSHNPALSLDVNNSNEKTTLTVNLKDKAKENSDQEITLTLQRAPETKEKDGQKVVSVDLGEYDILPAGYIFAANQKLELQVPYGTDNTRNDLVIQEAPVMEVQFVTEEGQPIGDPLKITLKSEEEKVQLDSLSLPNGYALAPGQSALSLDPEDPEKILNVTLQETEKPDVPAPDNNDDNQDQKEPTDEKKTIQVEFVYGDKTVQIDDSVEVDQDAAVVSADSLKLPENYDLAEPDAASYEIKDGKVIIQVVPRKGIVQVQVDYVDGDETISSQNDIILEGDFSTDVTLTRDQLKVPAGYHLKDDWTDVSWKVEAENASQTVKVNVVKAEDDKPTLTSTIKITYTLPDGTSVGEQTIVREGTEGEAKVTETDLKLPEGYVIDQNWTDASVPFGNDLDLKVQVKQTVTTQKAVLKVEYYTLVDGKDTVVGTASFDSSTTGPVGESYVFTYKDTFNIAAPKGYKLKKMPELSTIKIAYGQSGTIRVQVVKDGTNTATQTAVWAVVGVMVIALAGLIFFMRKNKKAGK